MSKTKRERGCEKDKFQDVSEIETKKKQEEGFEEWLQCKK